MIQGTSSASCQQRVPVYSRRPVTDDRKFGKYRCSINHWVTRIQKNRLNEVLLGMTYAFRACAEPQCSTIDFCSLSLQLRLLTCRNSRYKMTAEKGPVLESDIANNTTNHRFGDCVPKVWIFTCSFWAFTIPSPNYVPRLRLFCDLLRETIPLSHSRNFGLGKPIPIALQITGYPAQNRGLFWPSCDLPSCVISPLVCVPQSSIFQRAN